MPKIMLIDAAHPEETRVAVLDGTRVDDFDFETQSKKQLRGNIYLAKVTRVEPSLQAAFVEFGGNRHGFLAFGEIHPDYYQIPVADREALKAEFEAAAKSARPKRNRTQAPKIIDESEASEETTDISEDAEDIEETEALEELGEFAGPIEDGDAEEEDAVTEEVTGGEAQEDDDDDDEDDDEAEAERRRKILTRRYKIQEVIRRRQIMLVQVVKEERGNKGAALTTYLSLAGRYCVLMPNSGRGGGISRKISAGADRKRLKKIATELEVPHGMGLIVRTAGAKRTKTEIKRDYEYLIRAWETIRDQTLRSVAPAMIYEESSLVKRAIRDLYDKDVEEIYVEGEDAYREAKDFVRMLMPSHAKKVHYYREPTPIFGAHQIERQLETIFDPVVNLRSGGYIVINQTEALVAIDVNSGRATRERGIEQTALKTNLEAADESARQMRLRDLAGLVVIDFIDMEDAKNDRAVEKRMKDALRFDRARIQMGKISSFGLMELSRQRRRTSVLEGSSHVCEHCGGAGRVRSIESSALHLLRALDDEATRHSAEILEARAPADVAIYLLNEKREALARLEEARNVKLRIVAAPGMLPPHFELLSVGEHHAPVEPARARPPLPDPIIDDVDDVVDVEEDEEEEEIETKEARAPVPRPETAEGGENGDRRRRRRRGRRGGKKRREGESEDGTFATPPPSDASADALAEGDEDGEEGADGEAAEGAIHAQPALANGERPRRRRRRRGRGRGDRGPQSEGAGEAATFDQPEAGYEAGATQQPASAVEEPAYAPAPIYETPSAPPIVQAAPEPAPEPVAPVYQEPAAPEPVAAVIALEPEPELESAAEPAPAFAVSEVDYSPDQERREKFFARLSRWGKKEGS